MAPRETLKDRPKSSPKLVRSNPKTAAVKGKSTPFVSTSTKKTLTIRKISEKIPFKMSNQVETRQRTSTVPKVSTPKPKENKSVPVPSSVTKSAKKATWKRRPKPAHSGVPVPEKMKQLLQKQFQDLDNSL